MRVRLYYPSCQCPSGGCQGCQQEKGWKDLADQVRQKYPHLDVETHPLQEYDGDPLGDGEAILVVGSLPRLVGEFDWDDICQELEPWA